MKKLTIKHLAPYLPYKLKMIYAKKEGYPEGERIRELSLNNYKYLVTKYKRKPILRPLSDLVKEIEHNGEKLVLAEWIDKNIRNNVDIYKPLNTNYPIELSIETENYSQEIDLYDGYTIIQKLFEYHFDVFGLIENNLAININDL